jgi:hypothetical protein
VQGKVSNWAAAFLLAMAVLVLAMPREDGFLIPERRDWLGWLKRMRPGARRRREEEGQAEADRYVTDLRTDRDQDPMVIRVDQLPSAQRRWQPPVQPEPSSLKPPWKTAENTSWNLPVAQEPQPQKRPRRAPHDPPTVVIEIMRPAVEGDLGRYLAEQLPAYADESAGLFFVPRATVALGAPDHDGAPHHVDGDQGQEGHLAPLEPDVIDVEGQVEPGREERPGD